MKVLLIAHDAGPCASFRPLIRNGRPEWHGFLLEAGKAARPTNEELSRQIDQADVVLVGLSSKKTAEFEIEACRQAKVAGKKLAFFSDTFGAWSRAWFAGFRDYVSLVTVVVANEVSAAQALFPNAQVVTTGNPAWEVFHEPGDRSAARVAMGASEHESVIFISGCKDYAVNAEMLLMTFEAAQDIIPARVVFSMHPGDLTTTLKYVELMDVVCKGVQYTFLPKSVMAGEMAICGADVVVVYNAASLAMRAVALQLSLVILRSPCAAARFRAESESGVNPILQARAAFDGGVNVTMLSEALLMAICIPPERLGPAQTRFFPAITQGAYTEALFKAVEELTIPSVTAQ